MQNTLKEQSESPEDLGELLYENLSEENLRVFSNDNKILVGTIIFAICFLIIDGILQGNFSLLAIIIAILFTSMGIGVAILISRQYTPQSFDFYLKAIKEIPTNIIYYHKDLKKITLLVGKRDRVPSEIYLYYDNFQKHYTLSAKSKSMLQRWFSDWRTNQIYKAIERVGFVLSKKEGLYNPFASTYYTYEKSKSFSD